jgi:hypothetical protein
LFSRLVRAGGWLLRSGIQETSGGVSRHYRTDLQRHSPVSTEITGYAASAFVYLHALTGERDFLDAAKRAALFLARVAWDPESRSIPFDFGAPGLTYFFDCGIVVRGMLATWRATGDREFLDVAASLGGAMAEDFGRQGGGYRPVLSLPAKQPVPPDGHNWSTAPGCYQLKAALAWRDLAEATGDPRFEERYEEALQGALLSHGSFLPGHPDPHRVMDRLHAFLYFLEGLRPRAGERRCAEAIAKGVPLVERLLREIAPRFERSDVYAQLLRVRLWADEAGALPLDSEAARREASILAGFQAEVPDKRVDGGFYFGRAGGETLPHVNPVSTAFAVQALALWEQRGNGEQPPAVFY